MATADGVQRGAGVFRAGDGWSSGEVARPAPVGRVHTYSSTGYRKPLDMQPSLFVQRRNYLRPLLLMLALTGAVRLSAQSGSDLPRSTPEPQGISSSAILAFVQAADSVDAMNSFMLVRHGHVVAEGWWSPYDAKTPHIFYSLSKSFTSTAAGLAIAEGKLSLDDEVLKMFPDEAPAEPSANLRAMRVRDLL